jgi:exopolysaccharide biosynthesis polyprenyl glycosylphosphotransferase
VGFPPYVFYADPRMAGSPVPFTLCSRPGQPRAVREREEALSVLRESIDLPVEAEHRARPGFVPMLPRLSDALALVVAGAATGFDPVVAVYGAGSLLALNVGGGTAWRINPRVSDEAGWVLRRLAVVLFLTLPIAALLRDSITDVFVLGVSSVTLILIGRGIAYAIQRRARARGTIAERAVIVGTSEVALELARILDDHPEYGLRAIGFLDPWSQHELPLPVVGEAGDLEDVVRYHEVDRVLIAFGADPDTRLAGILRSCKSLAVDVHVVPRFWELGVFPSSRFVDDLWGIPLVHVGRPAPGAGERILKRAFDISLGAMALLVTSPLLVLAAVGVRLSSPGPVLFRQRRVGLHGRRFDILKFRTMRVNDESDTQWSVVNDTRITKVGRFLRRTGLDELPQLFNVLRGDMSLVGPRPERPHFVEQFSAGVQYYDDRHRMPSGVTGWAQIHGLRGDTSISERARFDNAYVDGWSLWRDIVIVARTIVLVLKGDGV